jgi:hypothetical protein
METGHQMGPPVTCTPRRSTIQNGI